MKTLTKRFLVSNLFNVNTGSLVSKKRLNELADKNGVPRISVTTDDNGQIGHYNDNEEISNARYFGNFITVNFFGKVYYHPSKASVEMKVHVLTLKSGKPLIREVGMYLVTALRKTFDNGSYNYGNQLSSSKIKKGQYYVELPVTPTGEPDFAYMTMRIRELEAERIRELEAERIRELEAYLHVTGLDDTTLSASEAQALTQDVKWKKFRIGDVFDIEKVRGINKSGLTLPTVDDSYDYITRTSQNNGIESITGKVDSRELNDAGTISLGLLQMTFFYRDRSWYAGQFVRKIVPKIELTKEQTLYFVVLFNALRPMLLGILVRNVDKTFLNTEIQLPVTTTGDIDFNYMQNYICAMEKQTIQGVVEYKDRVIAETKKVVGAE